MRFENRLASFSAAQGLRVAVLDAQEVEYDDDNTTYEHFGFKENSKQARFFTQRATRRVVGLLYQPGSGVPKSMTDARVVCRLFGSLDRDGSLELWHISVNALNPLNDSQRGIRWGGLQRGVAYRERKNRLDQPGGNQPHAAQRARPRARHSQSLRNRVLGAMCRTHGLPLRASARCDAVCETL